LPRERQYIFYALKYIDIKAAMNNHRPMTKEEELKEKADRIKLVRKWPKRLARLRKKTDMKESEFCRKYGLPIAGFNRMKKMKHVVSQENLDKVETALEAEGV